MKHNQNWRQRISPNLDKNFSVKGNNSLCYLIFYSNHRAKTTVERCNHTPEAPKVGLVGLDASQNQILLGIGCFSKITTEKYVERLVRSCVNMTAF